MGLIKATGVHGDTWYLVVGEYQRVIDTSYGSSETIFLCVKSNENGDILSEDVQHLEPHYITHYREVVHYKEVGEIPGVRIVNLKDHGIS